MVWPFLLIRAPGRSRTRNLVGRSHLLYPVELRGQTASEDVVSLPAKANAAAAPDP